MAIVICDLGLNKDAFDISVCYSALNKVFATLY